jgi:histidine ammonia-lyase
MITCRGSRPVLVDALHRSPVRSPSLSAARGLQDPPRFATCPICSAPLEDALAYARALVTIELNASDSNPIVLPVESAPVAVAN